MIRFLSLMLFFLLSVGRSEAVLPVIDIQNLVENVKLTVQAIAQTSQLVQQYKLQLQQYENMVQNTIAPSAFIWDHAQVTLKDMIGTMDTLNEYKKSLGNLGNYLSKFQNISYYRSSPCFSAEGCSPEEWKVMKENQALASETQKKANDSLFKIIESQQFHLSQDAQHLEELQLKAETAKGQMQAIQYGNQLASQQAYQLLQMRGLFLAQETALASELQFRVDEKAREKVEDDEFLHSGPEFKKTKEDDRWAIGHFFEPGHGFQHE